MTEEIKDWVDVDSCPVCGSKEIVEFLTNVPTKVDRPTTEWKLCRECSHLFCSPRPADGWIRAYYKKGYRQDTHGSEESDKVPARSAQEEVQRALRIVSVLAAFRGHGPIRRHLDIGSSTGALLASAMDRFAVPYTVGVEPNDAWRVFAENSFKKYLDRKKDDEPREMVFVPDIVDVSGKFDLITVSHSMEHISDVRDTMRRVERLLARGGVFYLETPFAFGGIPDPLMFPHLHAFTETSMRRLISGGLLAIHGTFLEGTSGPFWPPHQHLVMIATDWEPSHEKSDVMERYLFGREAARKATEAAQQMKPSYELG